MTKTAMIFFSVLALFVAVSACGQKAEESSKMVGTEIGQQAPNFEVYSMEGEKVTLAVLSDSAQTPWKDYFLYTFSVDWTGPRKLAIPFSDFEPYEKPAGWGKVDAVYFFTKIFDREPNPYTVLYLDDMTLEAGPVAPTSPTAPAGARPAGRLPRTAQMLHFDPSILNHPYPETRDNKPALAPIRYEPYFKAERAIYGYYPRCQPGFVSFSPQGKPYIQYGSYILETLEPDGRWQCRDLLDEVIEPYAREKLGFASLHIGNRGQTNDVTVRFDREGDAYMLCFVAESPTNWRSRTALLLHSRDGLRTWDVYVLPHYMARFEKFVGHNHDCLNRPPVILLSHYLAPTENFVVVPEKRPDGTLAIPEPTKIADEAIPCVPHSGEANQAVTHRDKVFIVFGQVKVLPGHTQEDGAPAYAVVYDLKTRSLSEPVLLGFGGINAKDPHNWPGIAVDSKGILHVVINGHHNHFVYVRSKRPHDIAEWTKPERVARGTSYAGLVCDKSDTLYTVTRNSHPGYYFRLSLHRKKPGQPWEQPKHLVLPFKAYYKIWYHKLVIDPATDRLFLSYYSQGASICVFKDEYLAYIYTWPDREKPFLSGKDGPTLPLGSYRSKPRKYAFYTPPSGEMTTLVSDDHGDTWHLATTKDFLSTANP